MEGVGWEISFCTFPELLGCSLGLANLNREKCVGCYDTDTLPFFYF